MAGWTDYLPDWSSADALRLCDHYAAIDALTTAVNERSVAVGLTPLTLSRLYSVREKVDALQTRIRALIALYVNHTVNAGDFTGLDTIPLWTNETIAAALEIDALNDATRLHVLRDWVHEQYRILNLLRWAKNKSTGGTQYSINVVVNGTYSDLVAAYNATEPVLGGDGPLIQYQTYHILTVEYEIYQTENHHYAQNINLLIPEIASLCDIYYIPTYYPVSDTSKEFYPLFAGNEKDKLSKYMSYAENEFTSPFTPFDKTSISPEGQLPPVDKRRSWYVDDIYGVFKFDGANGFQFRDWEVV